ncbi:MAG: BrnA antitoxin family protein [Candidatus Methanoperedenaceae archaeon]|nr:BrnA antitoxin family protein [Euryarchaeota archaeon]MCG2727276.1 BrnA antitoxin family protein [Candidatus Methanoperedenaceae archaeon]
MPEEFGSLEEFWAFWDTHSTADYEDLMEDVDVRLVPGNRGIDRALVFFLSTGTSPGRDFHQR